MVRAIALFRFAVFFIFLFIHFIFFSLVFMNVDDRTFKFEGFSFRESNRKLIFNQDVEVAINSRSAEVLLVLLENAGEIVEKDYFFTTVWDGAFVEDGNLAVAISSLRKAFRECGIEKELIQTIPKRGYRFVSDVKIKKISASEQQDVNKKNKELASESDEQENTIPYKPTRFLKKVFERKYLVISLLSSIILLLSFVSYQETREREESKKLRKIIIPPFTNLNQDEKKDLLGVAVADRLTSKFEKVNGLKAIPIWNSAYHTPQNLNLKSEEIKALADFILTGNYVVQDDVVKISTRLVRTSDWQILLDKSFQFDSDKSLVDKRDLIVAEIITANGIDEVTLGGVLPPTVGDFNQNSYLLYLQGINNLVASNMEAALADFQAVTDESPEFGNAWIFLSRVHLSFAVRGYGDSTHFKKAEAAIQKALTIEPNNFNFKVAEADVLLFTQKYTKAVIRYKELLKEDPKNPNLLLSQAILYKYIGSLDKSIEWTESFLEQSPGAKVVFSQFIYTKEYDRFEENMPIPGKVDSFHYYLGYVNLYKGDKEKAIKSFNRSYEINENAIFPQTGKVFVCFLEGKIDEAKKILKSIENNLTKKTILDGEAVYMIAQAYALIGDTENALRNMEKAIDAGFLIFEFFEKDPLMKNVKDNPEFANLIIVAKEKRETINNIVSLSE